MKVAMLPGGASGSVDVPQMFQVRFRPELVHQVATAYMANARQGTRKQKTRAEVAGGGRKPWRQKGTGRSRVGSIRSPLWRGGGLPFAARTDQNHSKRITRKMYRVAMAAIVSELLREKRLALFQGVSLEHPRTRDFLAAVKDIWDGEGRLVMVDMSIDGNLYLASRNLHRVCLCDTRTLSPVHLMSADQVLITPAAFKQLEETLS